MKKFNLIILGVSISMSMLLSSCHFGTTKSFELKKKKEKKKVTAENKATY